MNRIVEEQKEMISIKPDFVVDEHESKKAVLISISDWKRILSELEELDDIRTYDHEKSTYQDRIPLDQAVREIKQDYNE
jgi:hypothetical protein